MARDSVRKLKDQNVDKDAATSKLGDMEMDVELPGENEQPDEDTKSQAAVEAAEENAENSLLQSLLKQVQSLQSQLNDQQAHLGVLENPKVAQRLRQIKVVDEMDETPTKVQAISTGMYRHGNKQYNFSFGQVEVVPANFAKRLQASGVVNYL